MIAFPYRAAFVVAIVSSREASDGLAWLCIPLAVLFVTAVGLSIRATYRAMRRCIFCRGVGEPLTTIDSRTSDSILCALSSYEATEVRPRNVLVCDNCLMVYNCTPRDYAIVGVSRLEKDEAITAGVKLQIDDFVCHRCGTTLADAESPSLNDADRQLVDAMTQHTASADLRSRLFCRECKSVHLWLPLADTGYKYLRTGTMPNKEIQHIVASRGEG